MTRSALLAAAILLSGGAGAAERDCRVPEAPPGVRVAPPPGCSPPAAGAARPEQALRTGRSPGTVVLENGTEIRIGGRVRMDAAGQR